MTVGSVLGKDRLETPVRVAHGGRSAEANDGARSRGGQVLLKPPLTERVGYPHCAQYGLRLFQSIRCLASAYIAAVNGHQHNILAVTSEL